jgi:hypothetical protein
MAHAEGGGEAENLGADIADADRAERAPGQAHADVVELLRPAAGAGQPVLDQELLRQGQDEGDDHGRDRPAHAVGRQGHQHAVRGAGRNVDRVVAHAEARHELEALARTGEARRGHAAQHHAQPVVALGSLGREHRLRLVDDLPVDPRFVELRRRRGS